MTTDLANPSSSARLAALYRTTLLDDVILFWLRHGIDREHGEWFGYLHRDGTVSQRAKGNMFKGPFHLPRMLWICAHELQSTLTNSATSDSKS